MRITVRHHLTHTSQGVTGKAYLDNGDLYALRSTVAEEASGMAFADLLVEEIIRPLGMTRTVPSLSAARRDPGAERAHQVLSRGQQRESGRGHSRAPD